MSNKIKKCTICFFSIFVLLVGLYLSSNEKKYNINIFSKVFAAEESTDTNNTKDEKNQTNENQSSTATNKPSSNEMVELLARLINGEARGEPYQGQVAVGAVILNRVKSPKFPNTISSVIYQNNQFSCIKDGQFNQPLEKDSTVYKAAQEAMNGSDPSNGALYFYNSKKTSNKYLYSLKTTTTIGEHVFAAGD